VDLVHVRTNAPEVDAFMTKCHQCGLILMARGRTHLAKLTCVET